MWTLIRLLNLRHLRGQWLRTLLGMLGVVMGVATFIFVPALGVKLQDSLAITVDDTSGNVPLEIRATKNGITQDWIATLGTVEGIQTVAPVSLSGGLIVGQTELLAFFGVDPSVDTTIRTYNIIAGTFITQDNEVVLTNRYAQEKNLQIGDDLTLVSAGGVRLLKIVGLLENGVGVANLNSGDVVVMAIADALALRGNDQVDNLSLVLQDGVNADEMIARIQPLLSDDLAVGRPSDRLQGAQSFQLVVQMLLAVIASLVLGMGSMLIYNTINVSIVQRRSEIGILRALGMSQSEVRRLYILEGAVLGVIGSILGIFLGYVLVTVGSGLDVLPEDFTGSGAFQSEAALSVEAWIPPIAFLFGVIIPLIASYYASRAATQVEPVEAMVQIRAETGDLQVKYWRVVIGVLMFFGLLAFRFTYRGDLMLAVLVGNSGVLLSLVITVLLYAPVLAALKDGLPRVMQHLGVVGMVASSNITRRPKRVVVTGLVLAIGIIMAIFIGQSNFGYTEYIQMWQNGENFSDLTLVGAGTNPFKPLIAIPESVIQDVQANPNVANALAESLAQFEQDGFKYTIRALETETFRELGGAFGWKDGDESTAYTRLPNSDQPTILVAMGFATIQNNLIPNQSLTLQTPTGDVTFTVVGNILGGINTEAIQLIMDKAVYARFWQDTEVDRLLIQLKPEADVQTVRRDFLRDYALSGAIVYDNAEMRQAMIQRLASISTVSNLMTNLFVVIIVSGLVSTFYVFVLDRKREIGMLRAVGLLRRQIVQSIVLEGVILFGLAIVVGLPLSLMANLLQQMAMENLMGILFAPNVIEVILTLIFGFFLVLVTTILPAFIAGRTDILEAMRYE